MLKCDLDIFKKIPTIQTARLTLRKICDGDLADVYEYSRNPETTKYLLWYPHREIRDTKYFLSVVKKKYKEGDFFEWGIEYGGKMIGTCGFTSFSLPNNSAEIGYVINPEYKGIGIATEAASAVIDFGFTVLGLNRIEARYMSPNVKSLRVMQKCGMKEEGTLRSAIMSKNGYVDLSYCSILKKEYVKSDVGYII